MLTPVNTSNGKWTPRYNLEYENTSGNSKRKKIYFLKLFFNSSKI